MHDEARRAIISDGGSRQVTQGLGLEPVGTVPLSAAHNVRRFTSRSERIRRFIQEEAPAFIQRRYCRVLVWPHPEDPTHILGFYTLTPCSIERAELNNNHERKAPHGIPAPMGLIGYMGKSPDAPKGFGAVLIHDAAIRAARSEEFKVWGLALHPENEKLAQWYETLGFCRGRVWKRDNKQRLVMYGPLEVFLPGVTILE